MSVHCCFCCCHLRELSELWRVQILLYKVYFSQKQFFGELIVFRHCNMDFTIFLRVILSDVSKLPLSFKKKHNCKVKKYVT